MYCPPLCGLGNMNVWKRKKRGGIILCPWNSLFDGERGGFDYGLGKKAFLITFLKKRGGQVVTKVF